MVVYCVVKDVASMVLFFNDTATAEIYTLSLHDALPICDEQVVVEEHLVGSELSLLALCDGERAIPMAPAQDYKRIFDGDRKSTRLNSSHANISYAVFCLKKKKSADATLH